MTGEASQGRDVLAPTRAMALLFGAFAVGSYGYCLATGSYNGDFFGVDVTLSPIALTVVLSLALLPFAVAWWIFGAIRTGRPGLEVEVPILPFLVLLGMLFVWQGFVSLAYGVGVMMQEVYSAPAAIQPLIQVTNRFNAIWFGMLFILLSPRKARYEAPVAIAMVVLAGLRASLGAFLFVGLVLAYKYFDVVAASRRRMVAVLAIAVLGIPALAGVLYGARSNLRGEVDQELAIADLVFAQFVGRLSTFSDSAYVIQESGDLVGPVAELPALFYQRQILGSTVHSRFLPDTTPERILVAARVGFDLDTVSFMPGVPGILALSWMKSRWVFLLNALTVLLLVVATLHLAQQFAHPAMKDAGFLLLLQPLMSGVSYEFASVAFSLASTLAIAWIASRSRASAAVGNT